MRILISNLALGAPAGSEKNTYITAVELKRRGHLVDCFSKSSGLTARHLQRDGIICFEREAPPGLEYDVIFSGHKDTSEYLIKRFPKIPMVVISRSTYNMQECLSEEILNHAKKIIAANEEVFERLKSDKTVLIRNGVDLTWYKPDPKYRMSDRIRIVQLSRIGGHRMPAVTTAMRVTKELGGVYRICGFGHWDRVDKLQEELKIPVFKMEAIWDTADIILQGDIVMGAARCIMEGLACGKPCLPLSSFGSDDIVTLKNVEDLIKSEFHGKHMAYPLEPKEIAEKIRSIYNQRTLEEFKIESRLIAEKYFDNKKRVGTLEEIFHEVTKG